MNYHHTYHAGNFADVTKHLILLCLLQALQEKTGGITYLETHAGSGLYNLEGESALKTREADLGILKIFQTPKLPDFAQLYLDLVLQFQDLPEKITLYPGSPLLAQKILRPQDEMILCELHPEAAADLKRTFRNQSQVAVHHQDGYLGLKAFLPPKLKRGLVLIDPPYENKDEWETTHKALKTALTRWPNGVYAWWYPIKKNFPTPFHIRNLQQSALPNLLQAEVHIFPEDSPMGLVGSGMMIVNAPWKSDTKIKMILEFLAKTLGVAGAGTMKLEWLIAKK